MASGKSHLAELLILFHGLQRVSWLVAPLMGEDDDSLVESGVVDPGQRDVKQRRMLQTIGVVGREIDPMVWINDTLRCASEHERVVVDDQIRQRGHSPRRLRLHDNQTQLPRRRAQRERLSGISRRPGEH